MSTLKEVRAAEVCGWSAGVSGRAVPLWVLEPSAACSPAPPPSAIEPISSAGICWPISGPHVPFQQQPDLVYLEKNRKLGSARNQNTPFLGSVL